MKEIQYGGLLYYIVDVFAESKYEGNQLAVVICDEKLDDIIMQKIANEMNTKHGAIDTKSLRSIHENLEQILKLKNSLALIQSDKPKSDAFKTLDVLKKKFKVWRENNQASRTITCPHCSKMIMLKIRADKWEAEKHPYFKDKS